MKIVIATHNNDKLKELEGVFKVQDNDIELLSLSSFSEIGEIEETGKTLEENALLKAKTVNELTGLPTLSDDTGLEVDALHGDPGIYTARFAGENCSYYDNIEKLINELQKVPMANRTARFRTVIAYVDKDFHLCAEGVAEGIISRSPIGENGFGYDPVFFIPEKEQTFAEMSMEEKENYSHRGKAVREIIKLLIPHFNKINKTTSKEIA